MSDTNAPVRPEWDEEKNPSDSFVVQGADSPMAFSADKKKPLRTFDITELEKGVLSGDRTLLSRAITLIESTNSAHRALADDLLARLYPHSGRSLRVGITGVPGVGKSTFIEAMGTDLCNKGRKIAVLTIDPSSEITGGSILGDKTRMENLARHERAYIRPSPSRGVLGGVARWTREAMIVCEAAGFETIFIETVGVGQSETLIRSMVDCFLFLGLAGAGDDLQGIKKGIMELSDIVAVNKADGDNIPKAEAARAQFSQTLHYLQRSTPGWEPQVYAISALQRLGLENLWKGILSFEKSTKASGAFDERRASQKALWLKTLLRDNMISALDNHPEMEGWVNSTKRELPTVVATKVMKKIAPWG